MQRLRGCAEKVRLGYAHVPIDMEHCGGHVFSAESKHLRILMIAGLVLTDIVENQIAREMTISK